MDKIKPCPFCGIHPEVFDDSLHPEGARVYVKCGHNSCIGSSKAYWNTKEWNTRPQEQLLKNALDQLLRAIELSYDENYSRRTINARFREAVSEVKRVLGVAKVK